MKSTMSIGYPAAPSSKVRPLLESETKEFTRQKTLFTTVYQCPYTNKTFLKSRKSLATATEEENLNVSLSVPPHRIKMCRDIVKLFFSGGVARVKRN